MPSPDVSLPKQPKVDPEIFVEAFLGGGLIPEPSPPWLRPDSVH